MIFELQALNPSAVTRGQPRVNLESTWSQPGDKLESTWDQSVVNLGLICGQPGVNLGSTWVKLGSTQILKLSTCTALPWPRRWAWSRRRSAPRTHRPCTIPTKRKPRRGVSVQRALRRERESAKPTHPPVVVPWCSSTQYGDVTKHSTTQYGHVT